ncbi:AraC family transcriptional regulator [Saccharophagus sp. K07]|uniref:AraC family transcriptional regulator n=1 Tax=Saccharophagus sp. K07 TaxID=2283636 RepID=UPI001651CAA1|nr:AraC family transcriptional regulator [Saccharophagus sp. K07]MBC6905044.1 AraC family transcriptional regulator [Saccharophagus sp. K07]
MTAFGFSSIDFPVSERKKVFQDVYASIANLDIYPADDMNSFVELRDQLLGAVSVLEVTGSGHTADRTKAHVAKETQDNISLLVSLSGTAAIKSPGGERIFNPGDAVLVGSESVHTISATEATSFAAINIPRALLGDSRIDFSSSILDNVSGAQTAELRLMMGYVHLLVNEVNISDELSRVASKQILDLFTLMLTGFGNDPRDIRHSTIGALRLKEIKRDILQNIKDPELSIVTVAKRSGISPQYARSLFQQSGSTFSDLVNEARLDYVYRQLKSPNSFYTNISALAYDIGFNNLSWFNRAFKKKFGMTPKEARDSQSLK